jgi:tRNA A37 threonylcarbamoyladenosine synthetase subunit TsaC/SUA5/YrdC
VGTSINRSGEPALLDIDKIIEAFGALVDLIIVTEEAMSNESSSVIDLTETKPRVVRGTLPASLRLE